MNFSSDCAPVAFFCFRRINETKKAMASLSENYLAEQTVLYVFSDGARNLDEVDEVNEVRSYLSTIKGFKEVIIEESLENKGLANSVIDGVGKVTKKHGKVIVVEDDLVTSRNFLDFMNQALMAYKSSHKVLSVSGFTLNLKKLSNTDDYYVGYRASSWGWGTWEDRWNEIDWSLSDYSSTVSDQRFRKRFLLGGSDMLQMLKNQNSGKIDSWAIRFCYHQAKFDMVTIFPMISKVVCIGFGSSATHTIYGRRFSTPLDPGDKRKFSFTGLLEIDREIAKQFRSKFSIHARALDKVLGGIFRFFS